MPTTDRELPQVVVNKLTQAQYNSATKSQDEFYLVTDAKMDTADIADGAITSAKIDWSTTPQSYSTSEVNTGATWIDGKPIYKKTVDFGTLPNASVKHVDHNITNLDHFVKAEGIAWTASKAAVSLSFASPNQLVGAMSLLATNTGIDISTGTDRREFANCYVTLWYTKATN